MSINSTTSMDETVSLSDFKKFISSYMITPVRDYIVTPVSKACGSISTVYGPVTKVKSIAEAVKEVKYNPDPKQKVANGLFAFAQSGELYFEDKRVKNSLGVTADLLQLYLNKLSKLDVALNILSRVGEVSNRQSLVCISCVISCRKSIYWLAVNTPNGIRWVAVKSQGAAQAIYNRINPAPQLVQQVVPIQVQVPAQQQAAPPIPIQQAQLLAQQQVVPPIDGEALEDEEDPELMGPVRDNRVRVIA